eukprot:TRINITY_DN38001_c0_g1_i1.p1 TRINITY_DN38001_c0_g1~~TRINITY_DN38001_c0_g1_i1.p1  ORF type:complete len:246 (+),score=37.78 TRINITY_DN38001_c0_g1_i1:40-777(+)
MSESTDPKPDANTGLQTYVDTWASQNPQMIGAIVPPKKEPAETPCKFYERGECKYGTRCKNLHNGPGGCRDVGICMDYVSSTCPFGSSCKKLHFTTSKSEYTLGNIDKVMVEIKKGECAFYVQGSCKFGDKCTLAHNLERKVEMDAVREGMRKQPCTAFKNGKCSAYSGFECRFSHGDEHIGRAIALANLAQQAAAPYLMNYHSPYPLAGKKGSKKGSKKGFKGTKGPKGGKGHPPAPSPGITYR